MSTRDPLGYTNSRKRGGPSSRRRLGLKPGPQGNGLSSYVRNSTSRSTSPAWKPVISKEMGPGIRRGDVFTSLSGRSYGLGRRSPSTTARSLSDTPKRRSTSTRKRRSR